MALIQREIQSTRGEKAGQCEATEQQEINQDKGRPNFCSQEEGAGGVISQDARVGTSQNEGDISLGETSLVQVAGEEMSQSEDTGDETNQGGLTDEEIRQSLIGAIQILRK